MVRFFRPTPVMVTSDKALRGRETPVLPAPLPNHLVFGIPLDEVPAGAQIAYFALGCFWGEEKMFWSTAGVLNTAVGYQGGFTPNPSYEEVCTGGTGHTETVRVVFDPARVSYEQLARQFFEAHDPTQGYRQGNDVGTQYRSALFPVGPAQAEVAQRVRADAARAYGAAGYGDLTTEIADAADWPFYLAEDWHQQYLIRNPAGYCPVHATGVNCRPPA
ncbi:MAG: peptide-methionine (S)-S-oxide reductase MsrA [Brooklawnia sp.]|jgi:peptide-methionine (S)-S-oxide reductase